MCSLARCSAVAICLAAAPASAASITQTFTLSGTSAEEFFGTGFEVIQPIEVHFDRTLGTLTGVNFSYGATIDYTATVTNPTDQSDGGGLGADSSLRMVAGIAPLPLLAETTEPGGFSSHPEPFTTEVIEETISKLYEFSYLAGLDFTAEDFYQPSASSLVLGVTFSTDKQGSEYLRLAMAFEYRADLIITYLYDPVAEVPEPAAPGLFGLGLIGLGVLRFGWRRRPNGQAYS